MVFIGFANVFCSSGRKTLVKPMFFALVPSQKHWFYQCFLHGCLHKTLVLPMFFSPRSRKTLAKPIKTIKTKIFKLIHLESPAHSLAILVFMVFIGFANVFCSSGRKTLVKPMFLHWCLPKTLVLPMFLHGCLHKTLVLPMFFSPRSRKHWQNQ